jgi:hypothetical protein
VAHQGTGAACRTNGEIDAGELEQQGGPLILVASDVFRIGIARLRARRGREWRVPDPKAFDRLRDELFRKRWVAYAKRPFGGPEQVVRYLGRYTHRVGISNHRLVALDARGVTFRTKNGKTVTLDPVTFLDRFVEHVLPTGFVKIRHYGLLAPSNRPQLTLAHAARRPARWAAESAAQSSSCCHVPNGT